MIRTERIAATGRRLASLIGDSQWPEIRPAYWPSMKLILVLLSALLVSACVNDPRKQEVFALAGKSAVTTRTMYLYRADPHQFEVIPFVASNRRFTSAPGLKEEYYHLLAEWPVGTRFRIISTRYKAARFDDPAELLLIGETVVDASHPAQQFEFRQLLWNDGTPEFPFEVQRE